MSKSDKKAALMLGVGFTMLVLGMVMTFQILFGNG